MTADEFWSNLEYRVCREIDGLRTPEYRGWWCDGFIPEQIERRGNQAVFVGRVWMAQANDQYQWRFELHLPRGVQSESEIEWQSLLPAEDVTAWLSLDASRNLLNIDTTASRRDLDSR